MARQVVINGAVVHDDATTTRQYVVNGVVIQITAAAPTAHPYAYATIIG